MKKGAATGVMLLLMFLVGCGSQLPPLLTDGPEPKDLEQFERFGAVYEYDELRIREQYDESQGFTTTYSVHQKLHILNHRGLDYGTLEIPQLTENLKQFDIRLVNSQGRDVPLELDAIQEKYIASDEIIIPKVEPGSQIYIDISFYESKPMFTFEHWFESDIPILAARFSFFYSSESQYVFKTFNGTTPAEKPVLNNMRGIVFHQQNILPIDAYDLGGNRIITDNYVFDETPRILVNMKAFHVIGYNYYSYDWQELAGSFRDIYLAPSHFFSPEQLTEVVDSVTRGLEDDFSRADAILKFVQDNISLTKGREKKNKAVNITQVLDRKSGDFLEVVVVLLELMKKAGFETKVYITRSQTEGGFSGDFPTWRQLQLPLVSVMIGDGELVAYPYVRKAELGEMPTFIHNLDGLHLDSGEVVSLPYPVDDRGLFHSEVEINPADPYGKKQWKCIIGDSLAIESRNTFSEYSKSEQKEYWKNLIQEFSKDHEIDDEPAVSLHRGKDVVLSGEVRNDNITIERQGSTYTSLAPFFRKYFINIDMQRYHVYRNDHELNIEEKVRIKETDRLDVRFHCNELDNGLFRSTCFEQKEGQDYVVTRRLTLKKTRIRPVDLAGYAEDVLLLNRISESHFIEK